MGRAASGAVPQSLCQADLTDTDVLIVGGGPVGLFLGCCLAQHGIRFQLVERQPLPSTHTKSIGIHPPALARLAHVGVAERLIEAGVCVSCGIAFAGPAEIGRLSFTMGPGPYRFIVAIPQHRTEALLRQRLDELAPRSFTPAAAVVAVHEDPDAVCTTLHDGQVLRSRLVVGCDGMGSQVRKSAGFHYLGAEYPDRYVMGDFDDTSGLGTAACVFLGRQGLVESFPLPGMIRRWVARDATGNQMRDVAQLAEIIRRRTGHVVAASTASMFSPFRTFAFVAHPFARGRVLLAGDAGHVVSPIGGQGMNLGWMDVWDLVPELVALLAGQASIEAVARRYADRRSRAYRIVRRRAEFNMWMGREGRSSVVKQSMARLLLGTPLAAYFAARFSMRGLPDAP